jgi:hypothetical protein
LVVAQGFNPTNRKIMKTSPRLQPLTLIALAAISFSVWSIKAAGAGAAGAAGASGAVVAPGANSIRTSVVAPATAPVTSSTTALNPVTTPVVPSAGAVTPFVAPANSTLPLSASEMNTQQQAAGNASRLNSSVTPTLNGAVNPAAENNPATAVSGGAAADGSMNSSAGNSNGLNLNGAANAGLNAQVTANGAMGGAAGSPPSSMNSVNEVSEINRTTHADREATLTRIDSTVQANQRSIAELRTAGRKLKDESRKQFDTAYDDVRTGERNLRKSLSDARKASPDEYGDARAVLAFDYQTYSDALVRAEAAAHAASNGSTGINLANVNR